MATLKERQMARRQAMKERSEERRENFKEGVQKVKTKLKDPATRKRIGEVAKKVLHVVSLGRIKL